MSKTSRSIPEYNARHRRSTRCGEKGGRLTTKDKAAQIAKVAYETGKTVREVAREMSALDERHVNELLDPVTQTWSKRLQPSARKRKR